LLFSFVNGFPRSYVSTGAVSSLQYYLETRTGVTGYCQDIGVLVVRGVDRVVVQKYSATKRMEKGVVLGYDVSIDIEPANNPTIVLTYDCVGALQVWENFIKTNIDTFDHDHLTQITALQCVLGRTCGQPYVFHCVDVVIANTIEQSQISTFLFLSLFALFLKQCTRSLFFPVPYPTNKYSPPHQHRKPHTKTTKRTLYSKP
jgi:hypothetical protein